MKRNNAGSSLVEIVAATAIMGILVGAVCTSLMFGLRLNEKTDAQLKAQLAVSSVVETLMAEGIDPVKGVFTVTPQKDAAGNYPADAPKVDGKHKFTENGLYDDFPKLNNAGEQVTDENGNAVKIDRFSDITVTTTREKIGEDAEFSPYFEVTVTSEIEDVTITTHIREKKAVP
ncbi:MAG: hypothetical protein IIV43_06415, partial [Oscillospiraceae bacterium]|nr:hypothetical protein [Oscillospiraceae bacterium]